MSSRVRSRAWRCERRPSRPSTIDEQVGQPAPLPRQVVTLAGVLLFADEQLVAGIGPFFAVHDLVIGHRRSPFEYGILLTNARLQAGMRSGRPKRAKAWGVRKAVISSISAPRRVSTLTSCGMNVRVSSSQV